MATCSTPQNAPPLAAEQATDAAAVAPRGAGAADATCKCTDTLDAFADPVRWPLSVSAVGCVLCVACA